MSLAIARPHRTRHVQLASEERREQRIPVRQAAEIKGISVPTFLRHYQHLIERVSPGRIAVRLGDVLD